MVGSSRLVERRLPRTAAAYGYASPCSGSPAAAPGPRRWRGSSGARAPTCSRRFRRRARPPSWPARWASVPAASLSTWPSCAAAAWSRGTVTAVPSCTCGRRRPTGSSKRETDGPPDERAERESTQHRQPDLRVRRRGSRGLSVGHGPSRPGLGGQATRDQHLRDPAGSSPVPVPLRVRRGGVAARADRSSHLARPGRRDRARAVGHADVRDRPGRRARRLQPHRRAGSGDDVVDRRSPPPPRSIPTATRSESGPATRPTT